MIQAATSKLISYQPVRHRHRAYNCMIMSTFVRQANKKQNYLDQRRSVEGRHFGHNAK